MKNKKFGWITATAFIIANMIGTGVFTSLGFQLQSNSNLVAILLLWLVGGLIALFGALTYAEIGSTLPRSGGEYHFLTQLYSPLVGFIAGWVSLIVGFAAPVALTCLALASYAGGMLPGVNPKFLAAGVLLVVTAVHSFGNRLSGRAQNILTGVKVAFIVIFIILGFCFSPDLHPFSSELEDFALSDIFNAGFAVSIIWVYYAYSGWNASAYIVDDIEKPRRNLPLSLLSGTLVVTLLYLLLNQMFLSTTPVSALEGEVEVGLIAARGIFGDGMGNAMGMVIALLLLSSISAMVFIGPRVSMRMGEEHPVLGFLARKSGRGVPMPALLVQTGLSLVMIFTGSFKVITEYSGILLSACSVLTVAGVFILRKRFPREARPFNTPLYPLVPILFCIPLVCSIAFLVSQSVLNLVVSLGVVLSGMLVYFIDKYITKKHKP